MFKIRIIGPATAVGLFALSGAMAQTPTTPPSGSTTPPTQSQTAPTQSTPSTSQAQTTPARPSMPTDQNITDVVNARIAMLKAGLRLTAEQQGNWTAVETTLRDAAVARVKDRLTRQAAMMSERDAYRAELRKWREDQRGRTDGIRTEPPEAPGRGSDIETMKAMADRIAARAAEMRRVADSAGPLYDSLDEDQQRMFMHGIRKIGAQAMRGMGHGMGQSMGQGMGHGMRGHHGMGHYGMGHHGMKHRGMGYHGRQAWRDQDDDRGGYSRGGWRQQDDDDDDRRGYRGRNADRDDYDDQRGQSNDQYDDDRDGDDNDVDDRDDNRGGYDRRGGDDDRRGSGGREDRGREDRRNPRN